MVPEGAVKTLYIILPQKAGERGSSLNVSSLAGGTQDRDTNLGKHMALLD